MKKQHSTMILCALCASLSGCVNQNQVDGMQQRILQQEQQIQQLNMQLSGVQPAQADTWSQVQSMRQEMATVRGQLDELNAAGGIRPMVDKLNRHEIALHQIGTQLALDLNLDGTVPPGSAQMPTPGSLPSAPLDPISGQQQQPVTVPPAADGQIAVEQEPAPAPVTPPAVQNADTATALYDRGMADFNARRYKEAQRSFRDFTGTYAKHKLISNAWFWLGESYFQMGQFNDAILSYQTVIDKYPKSNKIASAYLKQGIAFQRAGQKAAAKGRLDELIRKFPTSPEASRAKQFLLNKK